MPTAFDDLLTDTPPQAGGEGFDDLLADSPPQEPLETGVRSAAMAPGQSVASAYSGLGGMVENLAETAGKFPGVRGRAARAAVRTIGFIPRTLGPIAGDIASEAQRVYQPDATTNPKAAAAGSAVGQALPMAASAVVAGPAGPLALGAGQGADQGIQQAEEMGITDPAAKLAMGGAYAATEMAVEKIGGFGSKALTAPIKRTIGQAVKEGAKTVASETIEEPLTGAIQDAIAARFAPNDYDVTSLAPVIPDENGRPVANPDYLRRRQLEAIGGAAGGVAGAAVQATHNAAQPARDATTPTPAADLTPDPLAAHAATMPEAAALPDYTRPGPVSYDDPGAMWGEMLTDEPPPPSASPIASVTPDVQPGAVPASSAAAPVVPATDAGSTPATGGKTFQERLDAHSSQSRTKEETWQLAADAPEGEWVEDGTGGRSRKVRRKTTGLGRDQIEFESQLWNEETNSWDDNPSGYSEITRRPDGTITGDIPESWKPGSYTDLQTGNKVRTTPKHSLSSPDAPQIPTPELPGGRTGGEAAGETPAPAVDTAQEGRQGQGQQEGLLTPADATPKQEDAALAPPASTYTGPAFGGTGAQATRETPVIPDAPYGGRDILDFVNDNTIAVPADVLDYIQGKKKAKLNKAGRGGDYDFLEKYEVPKGFRKFLFAKGETGNINEVAAMAHDEGLIDDPTPDALMSKILETIDARESYTRETTAREKQMADEEAALLQYEKENKLGIWADQIIADSEMTPFIGIDPKLMAAYTVKGAQLIRDGFTTFAKWSAEMVRRFGERVRDYLQGAWQAAMKTSRQGFVGGDPIRMTHEAERQRMDAEGKDPLPTGGQGTVEEWEAEARARVQQPGAAQALVSDIIEKQRAHTTVEYYMLMHYAGALDAQIERTSATVADPQTSEEERQQAAAILPGLNTERDRIAIAAQLAGSKAGAALWARRRGLDRAIIPSLSKMVADLTLIDDPTGRRPLAPEERARIEKIHSDMTAKAAAVENQENQASQDSYHNELKKLLEEANAEIAAQKEQIEIQQRALDNKLKPASLLTKTKATLTKWADDGDAALAELRAAGFFGQTNIGVDPSVILATARVIRGYMAKNAMKSGDAAAIIIKKMGHQAYAALEKFLPQILDKVKQIQQEELKKQKTTREGVLDKARKEMPKPGETAKIDPTAPPPSKSSGKLDTLQAVARKLALAHITDHIERGDTSMSAEKIAELVRADLEEFKPGITTREARDLISGYGDVKLPSKDIARKTLRDFRAQMQKLTQLEALLKQERLLKSGVQRDQPSARLRELQKQVEELKRETGYESRSREDELRSQRDRIKTSLNNQIEELQRILAGKARPAGGKERVIYDAELQSLQTMRNALKELVAEMPEHKRASEERRNKAALKAAKAIEAEWNRRAKASEWFAKRSAPTASPELTAARKAATEARANFETLKKQRTNDMGAMRQARAQLEAANKRVAEWQRRARDSEWTKPGAKPKEQGGIFAQVKAAKAMARQARADFEALKRAADPKFNPDAVALRQFKQRIQKQIADLETRMKAGDFEPRKKTPREIKHDAESTKLKHDLQQAKRRWLEMQLTHKLNNLSVPGRAWWNFRKAFHTARSIMTGGEFSGLLRQGLLKTVSHPIRVMRNDVPAMLKAFRSETGEFSVLSEIMSRPNSINGRYRTAKLALHDPGDFSAQMAEGNARSEWANKIPFIAGTGRAYTALLNHMRADLFDMMTEKIDTAKTKKGQTLSEAELKAIADFVNDTTGAGKLGVIDNRPGAKDLLGMLIFSPAFVSSRIRTLFGASLIGGSMDTRQAIAGEYLRITAGMAAVFALAAALQSAGDDEPEKDPRSSNFGKVQYGKTAVDLTAGLGNTAVMIARTLMGEIKKSNGTIQPTRGEGVPYGATTAGDVVGRWIRSKLSPGASFTWNRITGTDYSGKPASFTTDTANLLRPITYNDVAQIWREQPASRAIPLSAAAIFGLGTQTRDR